MIKIYHNTRCSKSRCTLEILESKTTDFEVINYLTTPPSVSELSELIKALGITPYELIRKGEAEFKELYKGKELTDQEWIEAMVAHPKLIERPIVYNNGKAIIGRPPEKVLDII